MIVSIENGKICNKTKLRKGLERLVVVWIVDEANGFGLEFLEKAEGRFKSITPGMGAVL